MVHVSLPPPKPTYTFSSVPRTPWYISKCKDEREGRQLPHGNIMFDKRVVRGLAFGRHPTSGASGMTSHAAREAEARRRAATRRKIQRTKLLQSRLGTPPPVEGRKHDPTQTEIYIEELLNHPIEISVQCQTELMLDRPESPFYIPDTNGVDISTQIKPGELFDFDLEVEPILDVLVGKTLEQSLVEIMEEEELECVRIQQREFKEERNAELAEEQRLQEQDTRRKLQIEHRLNEHEKEKQDKNQAQERIAAAIITTGFLGSIIPDVVRGLQNSGNVLDPIQNEVENVFMTWLMREVKGELNRIIEADKCILGILKDIQRMREETAKDECSDLEESEVYLVIEEELEEAKIEVEEEAPSALQDDAISVDFSWGAVLNPPLNPR